MKTSERLYPVYTIQPVVNLSNRLYNRFDNRLYRVNGDLRIFHVNLRCYNTVPVNVRLAFRDTDLVGCGRAF